MTNERLRRHLKAAEAASTKGQPTEARYYIRQARQLQLAQEVLD
jgi:hypothetical protein